MKKDLAYAKSFFREIHLRCMKYLLRKCYLFSAVSDCLRINLSRIITFYGLVSGSSRI